MSIESIILPSERFLKELNIECKRILEEDPQFANKDHFTFTENGYNQLLLVNSYRLDPEHKVSDRFRYAEINEQAKGVIARAQSALQFSEALYLLK